MTQQEAEQKSKERLSLVFNCVVQDGEGAYSRMTFPGKTDGLFGAPDDWPEPEDMIRGSLNCRVTNFPDNFLELAGDGDRIQALDSGQFEPEFSIPGELIKNNRLRPLPDTPERGAAQIWRCDVKNEETGETFKAWHSRRIDGTYPPFHDIIELMSDKKLRDTYNLKNGTPLTITMYSRLGIPPTQEIETPLDKDKKKTAPLVMAYIGDNDPHRGDCKASLGLSRLIAKMTEGQYVYVDRNMLNKNFPNISDIEEQLRQYCNETTAPDIVIGPGARWNLPKNTTNKTTLIVDDINETLAAKYSHKDLVPHHLTTELLSDAGKEFQKHYPQIKGPLVAIMMGGYCSPVEQLAPKLIKIASHYPEITFFLCPSRRTSGSMSELIRLMNRTIKETPISDNDSGKTKSAFNYVAQDSEPLSKRIQILSVDYRKAISKSGYNPYLGLLDQADHIVVVGESYSLVSEALFTGKNIYLFNPGRSYRRFKKEGYVSDISTLDDIKPFPTRPMPRLDSTHDIAKSIAEQYQKELSQPAIIKFLKKLSPF